MVISRQSRQFLFVDNKNKILLFIYTLTWRVRNYVSLQGNVINRRNESTNIQEPCYQFFIQLIVNIDTCCYFEELRFVALSILVETYKNNSVFTTTEIFLFKNGNSEKQEKVGGRYKREPRGLTKERPVKKHVRL